MSERKSGRLNRALGVPGLTFFGVGMILGAGIYSVVGAAVLESGPLLWQSFLLAGLVALLTGLSYGELSSIFPKAGAEYVWLSKTIPRATWLAASVALLVAFSGIATSATVALAFAGYLAELRGWGNAEFHVFGRSHWVALAVLGAATSVAIAGIRASAWVNILCTLIEAAGLALVIAVGFGEGTVEVSRVGVPTAGVLSAAALVFFSFLGFENIATLAEEAKEPRRQVPIAILVSVLLSTTLYALVALAVVALVPVETLGRSDAPLAVAVGARSPIGARALSAIALFATANTALVSMIVSSRLLYGMASEGELPAALTRTNARKAPSIAVVAVACLAAMLTCLGRVPLVAAVSSFVSLVAFFAINVALIVLRLTRPRRARPFRVPLTIRGVPVPAVLGALSTLVLLATLEWQAQLVGASALLVALGGVRWWQSAGASSRQRAVGKTAR